VSRAVRLAAISAVGLVVIAGGLMGYLRDGLTGDGLVFILGALTLYATGALLVWRVPGNRISWLVLVVGFGLAILVLFDNEASGELGQIFTGMALFGIVLPGMGVFVPLWFPTGRVLTPRWRWVSITAALGVIGIIGGWALLALQGAGSADVNACDSIGSCSNMAGLVLLLLAVVGAIVSLVVRWVRSKGTERLQMKWLVLAFGVFLIGVIAEFGGFQYSLVANVFLPLGLFLIPVAIFAAVTRYQLYEIDRILSRTVTYAVVIAFLGAVYLGAIAALTVVLPSDSPLAVAGSTLAAAALFNPMRRRVQGWVDRHFNRSRYDTERVISGFTGALRDEVDPERVVGGWVSVVNDTMKPASSGVWVRDSA
jgi:hypothetical protein